MAKVVGNTLVLDEAVQLPEGTRVGVTLTVLEGHGEEEAGVSLDEDSVRLLLEASDSFDEKTAIDGDEAIRLLEGAGR